MQHGTIILVGASRGIGAAVAAHLAPKTRRLISISRSASRDGEWVRADVATDEGLAAISSAAGDAAVDALLYLGGVWEKGAFTNEYVFAGSPPKETRQVIAVNLVAPILLAQSLAGRLAKAANPRIVLMGSLSGKDNAASIEVANTASKFGLRGAAQALALALRPQNIGVTVINPGNVATEEVLADVAEGRIGEQQPLPLADISAAIDFVLGVSAAAVPSEIDLHQKQPG